MLISERAREGAVTTTTANKSPRIILPRAKKKFGKPLPLKPLPLDFLHEHHHHHHNQQPQQQQQQQQSKKNNHHQSHMRLKGDKGNMNNKSKVKGGQQHRHHRRSQSSFLPSLGGFTGIHSIAPLPSPEEDEGGLGAGRGGNGGGVGGGTHSLWTRMITSLGQGGGGGHKDTGGANQENRRPGEDEGMPALVIDGGGQ